MLSGWPKAVVLAFRPVRKFSVGGVLEVAGPDVIAGGLQFGHVLVVEEVKALRQRFNLPACGSSKRLPSRRSAFQVAG